MDEQNIRSDLAQIQELKPPAKRTAYSDRTAWLMAALAEIAYVPFEGERKSSLLALAAELAKLTDAKNIAQKLEIFGRAVNARDSSDDAQLRSLLEMGGFRLEGTLLDCGTDTQGFVASRQPGEEPGMAVVCFRGTTDARDWMTNLDARKSPVFDSSGNRMLGYVHEGFHHAYKSVEPQIHEHLEGVEDLPLYIVGHSLGGALATLATWYLAGDRLAACYTFGAPKVGDSGLGDRFRTPIYRIVNGADPVPFVPPSRDFMSALQWFLRQVGKIYPVANVAANWLARFPAFEHYGWQRYLSMCPAGDGTYPKLRVEYGISAPERCLRYLGLFLRGHAPKAKRLDKYHDMALYRAKLRAYAIRRQRPE